MRYIEIDSIIEQIKTEHCERCTNHRCTLCDIDEVLILLEEADDADVVEVDKVAEMLRHMFADDCACNYNGNDEWLPTVCKYAETDCPMPKERLGCWKEFVKHYLAKMDGERKEDG